MFDRIAPYYDFLNGFLSAGIDTTWRRKTVKIIKQSLSPDNNNPRIIDLATGTGDLAIEVSRQLKGALITGQDISPKMLEIGKKKIKKKGLDHRMTLDEGDAESLKYESNYFDGATVGFGVRNFGNLEKGLKEIHRILKPGSSLVVLEFSTPRKFPIKQSYNAYFKYVLPVIGRITSKDPKAYRYLYESVQHFPNYEEFEKVLQKIGFTDTFWKPLTFGICTIYVGKK